MLAGFAQHIQGLIDRLGREVTHRSVTKGGTFYDPTDANTDTSIIAVIFDFESNDMDGSVIQRNDKEILVSAVNTTIKKDDLIIDDGIAYTIINLEELQPGNEKFLYIIQGRA